jgi:hypothetical protein
MRKRNYGEFFENHMERVTIAEFLDGEDTEAIQEDSSVHFLGRG